MIRRKKILATGCLSLCLITTQMSPALYVLADTETVSSSETEESSSSESKSTNYQEGNWVYSLSSSTSDSSGGMGDFGGMSGTLPSGMPDMSQSSTEDTSDSTGTSDSQTNVQIPSNTNTSSSTKTATILWGTGTEKTGNVVMVPASLGGYDVTVLGNGAQNISSNNKISDNYVLIPEGVTTLSNRMLYDYNNTSGFSIPSTVSSINSGAFLSCPGTFYGESDSAAETYAESDETRDFITYDEDGSKEFTIESEDNGYIQPNGTYHVPSGMLDGEHTQTVTIVADYQYKIKTLIVDGEEITDAEGKNTYEFDYTFTTDSDDISVTYEADPDDERDASDFTDTYTYDAPEINIEAVTSDIDLDDSSLYEYHAVNTGATSKYTNTMGISTGDYYSTDGKVYQMTYSSQATEEPEYYSKAEAINDLYETQGLVYGQDYDYIRLYNYYESVSSGPSQGEVALYCTYLYKEIDDSEVEDNVVSKDKTNTASLFVQSGANLTLKDFTTSCYTSATGPSEAGNFFGLGSSIQIDGGDYNTPATNKINLANTVLTLLQPKILGTVNSIYAAANGTGYIEGGDIFSCSSGGHGPYVSSGGQLLLNVLDTNLVSDDGTINEDIDTIDATNRPSSSLGTMSRIDGTIQGVYEDHDDDETVIVTGDEAGTALATDTGGGVIVANQVSTKTYGLRCAGVYSIGSDESYVYCYNSTLTSYLDAGLCSASGGYINAYNCDISGVMGIKTRAGGNTNADYTGVHVTNSRVSAEYDDEEMESVYDVANPDEWDDSILDEIANKGATAIDTLNIFLDKANDPAFNEESLDWWFTDKSKTPGYSGGNKFSVIYVENSSSPIYVNKSYLVNQNYLDYGDASTLEDGQTPADNLLVSVEGAGSANVYFTDENSDTKWDLTDENSETCELNGDFYLGEYSSTSSANIGSGANTLNANFENSEWTGTIEYGDEDETGIANLTFDKDSYWTVTADTKVANLEAEDIENITADSAVTVTYDTSSSITPGTYGNVTFVLSSAASEVTVSPEVSVKTDADGTVSQVYTITNEGTENIDLSKLKIRYYYTKDDTEEESFWCDYAGMAVDSDPYYVSYDKDSVNGTFGDGYVELSFADAYELSNETLTLETRFNNESWASYSNFKSGSTVVYYDGEVVS